MSEHDTHGYSRGESAAMEEIRALRAEIHAFDSKRDALVESTTLLAQSMRTLTERVDELADRDERDHTALRDCIEVVRVLLVGDKQTLGLVMRVDRIEQAQLVEKKTREWIGRVAAALLASAVTAAIAWVIHH